ncbi:MAG: type II toxin-antitoxin system VapC family toxin [Acidobacteriota bacterium]
MILVDTSVMIDYLRGDAGTARKLHEIGKRNAVLNSLVVMELLQGARNKAELNAVKRRLDGFRLVEIDQGVSDMATSLVEKHAFSTGMRIPDAIIAATAAFHGIRLWTVNRKDFDHVRGLALYD